MGGLEGLGYFPGGSVDGGRVVGRAFTGAKAR